jgi:hypothetical protein
MATVSAGRCALQKLKTLIEPLEDLLRRQQGEARCREFERERHAVEAPADLCDGRGVARG